MAGYKTDDLQAKIQKAKKEYEALLANQDPKELVLNKVTDISSQMYTMQMDAEESTMLIVMCITLGFVLTFFYMRALADEVIRKLGGVVTSNPKIKISTPTPNIPSLAKDLPLKDHVRAHFASFIPVQC